MGGYYNPYAAQAAGFSAAHMAAMAAAAQQSGQVREVKYFYQIWNKIILDPVLW